MPYIHLRGLHRAVVLNERQRLMIHQLFDGFEGKLTTSKWAKMAKCPFAGYTGPGPKVYSEKDAAGGRSTRYELNLDEAGLTLD